MASCKPWVGGNWKCNGTMDSIDCLAESLNKANFDPQHIDVVICPPTIYLSHTKSRLNNSFKVCAQNCSKTGNGAYTGETSVAMLIDLGLEWTLIGHSERRQYYGETDEIVAEKTLIAQQSGINAAVCIGETLTEREEGKTDEVCERQLEAVIGKIKDWDKVVVAYEPVWAIGTGKVAAPQQAQDAHEAIRKFLKTKVNEQVSRSVRIVYGGSVTAENCETLIMEKDIDGFLVGGASLKPSFVDIIKAALEKNA